MASENAGLEATNANLLALNAALTVENRLLKRLQEEADQRDGDLARARAKAKADAERAARDAAEREREARERAERERERDEAERRAREKAAEGAKKKSSPKSPKRKRDKKLSELGDGFYTLPNEKVKRFVRVVGDQVMVRGGGGFYTLEQCVASPPPPHPRSFALALALASRWHCLPRVCSILDSQVHSGPCQAGGPHRQRTEGTSLPAGAGLQGRIDGQKHNPHHRATVTLVSFAIPKLC